MKLRRQMSRFYWERTLDPEFFTHIDGKQSNAAWTACFAEAAAQRQSDQRPQKSGVRTGVSAKVIRLDK